MGLFKKERTDGMSYDGQGDGRQGFIDRIKYNGEADELVWKFPYDNLSIGAQLIVNQSQEAVFFKGGMARDLFTAGTHTISANNIPVLQRLINLPFSGNTPFSAEMWYVNKTAKRGLKWGSATPVTVFDPLYRIELQIGAAGEFGVKITDSVLFITEIVGTLHLVTTDDIVANFKAIINRKLSTLINDYVAQYKVNFSQLAGKTDEASSFIREQIAGELGRYGVEVVQFDVERIVPIENEQLEQAREIQRELTRQQRLGYTYQQERSFDVMETAAGNEGSAGQMMGAGMGLGMGVGVGGAFGSEVGVMASAVTGAGAAMPPPTAFHILVNDAQQGPYDMNALAGLVQSGHLKPETYVWKPGMDEWAKAADREELQPLFGEMSPPAPPTAK